LRAGHYGKGLPTGEAVATTAGRLPARWVIHTVGPVFATGEDRTPLLRSCYVNSLRVADELGARSIAFPLISAGIYRWPKPGAVEVALSVLSGSDLPDVRLVLYDDATRAIADEVAARR
jgi:O-acetyl-ADP-ribose deacetylase (regulator of RNase III)